MIQQQWEAERQLHAEATIFAAQTSTQFNVEFRMEYDTSARKDEFNFSQMQSKLKRQLMLNDKSTLGKTT